MDKLLPYLFIALALALILGPVMMLQPSLSDRQRAKLRSRAVQCGLRVHSNKDGEGTYYFLPWSRSVEPEISWCLKKQNFAHESHFYQDWHFEGHTPKLSLEQKKGLTELISSLDDVLALGMNQLGVFVCWSEYTHQQDADQCVARIEAKLTQLNQLFSGEGVS